MARVDEAQMHLRLNKIYPGSTYLSIPGSSYNNVLLLPSCALVQNGKTLRKTNCGHGTRARLRLGIQCGSPGVD